MSERTLVFVKPDGVRRGLVGEIVSRFEAKGLRIVTFSMRTLDPETADVHYAEHVKKALQPIAPDVEVQPLIVFVDPRATIVIEDPTVPVLRPDAKQDPSLKDYLFKKVERKGTMLTPEQIRAFEEATLPGRVLAARK